MIGMGNDSGKTSTERENGKSCRTGCDVRDTVLELYRNGADVSVIAALVPCSEDLVRDILTAEGIDRG